MKLSSIRIARLKEERYGQRSSSTKILFWFLIITFLGFIVYSIFIFTSQSIITTDLKLMQTELINTLLPLNSFLSRATGNVNILGQNHSINVKSALYYHQQKKTYKITLLLLNPSYETINCTGELLKESTYPIKINLIWQPMPTFPNQYELICESYNNFNQINKKILLKHINVVKFRFLEHMNESTNNIKSIDQHILTKNHNKKLSGVQIGMLLQSANPLYSKEQYKSYNVFNEKINLIDRFLHKIVYITVQSNLS